MTELVIAACDGAAKGNPGRAAWAWVVVGDDGRVAGWAAGPMGTATNNQAELTALLKLLEATDPGVPLEVRMDSQYAINAVTTWLPGWRRKGWKTASGGPVANKELVVRIDGLLTGRKVRLVHVPAHRVNGDPYNEAADRAASHTARTQEAARGTDASTLPPPEPTNRTERDGRPTRRTPRRGRTTNRATRKS